MQILSNCKKTLGLLCVAFSVGAVSAQGFLHADGKRIVDVNGEEIILRGHAPGGWVLQEPYMLEFGGFAGSQHEIRENIESVLGKEYTAEFYRRWHANGFKKEDVDMLADLGFNSIRLPLHYNIFTLPIEEEPEEGKNTWLEEGFKTVDEIVEWCTARKIYLILDMHATPGGQGKDAAISDYDESKPSLWESKANQDKLVALWVKLADRYAKESYVGGYDLVNEPNWAFDGKNANGCEENKNTQIWNLYKRLVDAIREVDQNHMMIFEGNCWCNNFNGLPEIEKWDDNLCLEFHKYWTTNDIGSIQFILDLRNKHNVPVWCGESGENSNHWYTEAVKLFEDNKIGWSWWTWKKIGSITGIYTIKAPEGYETLKEYWEKVKKEPDLKKPDQEFAKNVMYKLAENSLMKNCTLNKDVIDALLRQPHEQTCKPYSDIKVPGRIYASDYDMGQNGIAYLDLDGIETTHTSGGDYTSWNQGWAYRANGVDIQTCKDTYNSNGYNVGWTSEGEWMKYTIHVEEDGAYKLSVRYATTNNTKMRFEVDGAVVCNAIVLTSTGSWEKWNTAEVSGIVLSKGEHTLKVTTTDGGANLSYYSFTEPVAISTVDFKTLSATTTEDGRQILLSLNKDVAAGSLEASDFIITSDDEEVTVTSVALSEMNSKCVVITLADKLYRDNTVNMQFRGRKLTDVDGNKAAATRMIVYNVAEKLNKFPGQINVEDYYEQSGLSFETCNDKNGGATNFGYTDPGDYVDFLIYIPEAGTYSVQYRIAAEYKTGGEFELQLFDAENEKTVVGTYPVESTGGWQTWKTQNGTCTLPMGAYRLRLYITKKEFNMNWISFTKSTPIHSVKTAPEFTIYPNPCHETLNINTTDMSGNAELLIYDLSGKTVVAQKCTLGENITIDLSSLKANTYFVTLKNNDSTQTQKLVVK